MNRKIQISDIIICSSVAFVSWFPMIFVSFMNDDFQIIGGTTPGNFLEIFSPFWNLHSWGYYWRPLVKLIYNILLFLNGFQPFLFHLTALVLYSIVPGLVVLSAHKIGFDRRVAVLSGLVFAMLPSHELHTAWLSDMVENLSAIFILITFIKVISLIEKKITVSADYFWVFLFFLLSLFSKEIAFILLILPLLILIIIKPLDKIKLRKTLNTIGLMIITFSLYLFYRIVFINSNPFGAHHFNDSNIISTITNFLLYIPVSFVSPDWLEIIFFKFSLTQLLFGGIVLTVLLAMIIMKIYPTIKKREKELLLFSGGWYLVFIIPVLPAFMRWYAFIASIGLVWLLSFLIIKISERLISKKYFYMMGLIFFLILFYTNISTSLNWGEAGAKMDRVIQNIHQNKNHINSDTIVVWGLPDKYKRVPIMKLGSQQAFQYALDGKMIEVLSPLRSEIALSNSNIEFVRKSDSTFTLVLEGGRFLQEGGKSRRVFINEELEFANSDYSIKVKNKLDDSIYPHAKCDVVVSNEMKNYFHLYYDGNDFRRIKFK